ncbi:MAG TPA: glucose 1-dehydrogenase [Steroidobacteraceae bacterium]|nr:glucose 1-dehydrogenase [Steroidobacteraceae bacterium]
MMQRIADPFRVDGKVALVTGAARGIGACSARLLAAAGAKVVVTDVESGLAEQVVQEIRQAGGEAIARRLDVTDEEQWQVVIGEAVQTFGGIDVVVNNAGVENLNLVEDMPLLDWRQVMSVNSDGVFLGVKHAIRAMKPGGISGRGGSIINMASICAMVALRGAGSYSAAKAAITNLTKIAAVECGQSAYGIRVNSIHPGVILTDLVKAGMEDSVRKGIFKSTAEAQAAYEGMHPIGHLGEPEDIAHAVLYLASDASRFMTGAELVVDGGFIAQ